MTHCSSVQTTLGSFSRVFTLSSCHILILEKECLDGPAAFVQKNTLINWSVIPRTTNLYRRRTLKIGVEAKQCHRLSHAFKILSSRNACHVETLQQEPYTSHALLEIGAITNKSRGWVGGCISSRLALVVIYKHYQLLIGETR